MVSAHRVLVTAVGGNIGQGVLKSLRAAERRSFYIVGIDMEPLSAGFSLSDSYYSVSKTGDYSFRYDLEKIVRKEEIEAIYVNSPGELEFFSSNKESLEHTLGISVFVNPLRVVCIGSDKLETVSFLREAGLPYPETALSADEEGIGKIIEKYGFPLIVKPRRGATSKNVFVLNSCAEISSVCALYPDMIIQRYIPDDNSEFTATVLSGYDGRVRASIVLRRGLNQGTTCRTELVQDESLTKQVRTVAESLGVVGVCNFQFRALDGKVFVFEINPRFSGTAGIRYLYGFNDAEMVFELLRLDQEVCQPELRPAVVLRYWNEIFIPEASFQTLRNGDKLHCGIQTLFNKPVFQQARQTKESSGTDIHSLDEMADKYYTTKALGPDRKQMGFIMDAVLPNCIGPRILELGYGSGHWTQRLVNMGFEVTVIEGSSILAECCKDKFGNTVNVIHSMFEEYIPEEPYHTVIASCVLEHIENCDFFLALLKSWIVDDGSLHLVVPNALSLHRRIGLKMGMLKHPMQLSPQELEVGHRRAFTTETFREQLKKSGLKVNFINGIFVKPLSSSQMMDWPEDLFSAYNQLSNELPEYAAFLYGNCSKSKLL